MNIPEVREKIKLLQDRLNTRELYTVLLILVVGFGSFGLGRLSTIREGKPPVLVEQANTPILSTPNSPEGNTVVVTPPSKSTGLAAVHSATPASGGQLVASKGGTKYYFPWCGSAARISEANKIWFNSVEEARKAGYTPASNCKGLK